MAILSGAFNPRKGTFYSTGDSSGYKPSKISDSFFNDKPIISKAELQRVIGRIFKFQQGEKVLFVTDHWSERGSLPPDKGEQERAIFLSQWHAAAKELSAKQGFELLPILSCPQTTRWKNTPDTAIVEGVEVDFDKWLSQASPDVIISIARLTLPYRQIIEGSARANSGKPARVLAMTSSDVSAWPAMSADCEEMDALGRRLLSIVQNAVGIEVEFFGKGVPDGATLYIDTRINEWNIDSGLCRVPGTVCQFPAGEIYTSPFGGNGQLGSSQTQGMWPVYSHEDNKIALLKVLGNRVVRVYSDSVAGMHIDRWIAQRGENNDYVGEIAFGLSTKARKAGVAICEAEKAIGLHIALGGNHHFVNFGSPVGYAKSKIHKDEVYNSETPITASAWAVYADGSRVRLLDCGKLTAV